MSILDVGARRLPLRDQLDLICTSGRPFQLLDVKILDASQNVVSVPAGEGAKSAVGVVYIRGRTLFAGYLSGGVSSPGIVSHSGTDFAPDGFFGTGDLGFWSSRGYLNIVECVLPATLSFPFF